MSIPPPDTADGSADPSGEAALLDGVRAGRESDCETFVRRYGRQMLAVARRLLPGEADAEDAVQEAFVSAFRSIGNFAGDARVSTWLHRIVVNQCLMKLRAAKSRRATAIESLLPTFDDTGHQVGSVSDWGAPAQQLEIGEMRAFVRRSIDSLPEGFRTVLLLRDIEELDTRETAEKLGMTEAAVKVRLHRARQALRTLLDPVMRGERPATPG